MNINFGSYVQILFLVLVFVVPAIVNFVKYLNKQREQRAREQVKERAAEEALRTGRDTREVLTSWGLVAAPPPQEGSVNPTPLTEAQARKAEMDARRKAQLDELRRRAEARRKGVGGAAVVVPGGGATTMPAPVRRTGQGPQRPVSPTGVPPPRAPQRRGPQQPPQRVPSRAGPADRISAPRPDQRRRSAPRPQPTPALVVQPEHETTNRLVTESASSVAPKRAMITALQGIGPVNAVDWRRAIIMREIFDRPISLRSPHSGTEIFS